MVEVVAAPISLWARRYIETFGLALVAIEPGEKAPKGKGWNQPGGYFTEASAAEAFWQQNPRHNMGVVLGPSRVCSLDVDDVACTRQVLWDLLEVDLDALALVYPTAVGNPARFRILFRVPDGVELSRHALSWPLKEDPSKRFTVVEFRAGLVQDVLPPSIHPGTGRPYEWRTPPSADGLPELPMELLQAWQNWDIFKRDAEAACPWAPKVEPRPCRKAEPGVQSRPGRGASVIDAFNRAHDVEQLLSAHGYKRRGQKWLYPASTTGLPGVTVTDGRVFSHHAADPLANDHQNDAFDVFCLLEHGGDVAAATRAAAQLLGLDRPAAVQRPPIPPAGLAPARDVESAAEREPEVGGEASAADWMDALRRTDQGGLMPELSNAYLILKHAPEWQGVLAYNEFADRIEKLKPPPVVDGAKGPWCDIDASKALVWLQVAWGLRLRSSSIADEAVRMVAWDNRFHPVKQWLDALPVWDGVERLGGLMTEVFGADDNEYTRHIGKALLVSAVARVLKPGCKVDEMVVLEGGQGLGKSTCIAELFGFEWYLETSEPPTTKDFYVVMQGNWVVEIGEMQSFSKADINQVKMAITRRDDKYRAPYDRHGTSHPRQCVFVGTTNADSYLSDPTGARRFLPVLCHKADLAYVRFARLDLWAEALALFRSGFRWWDYPKELAQAEQDARYVEDPWEEAIIDYLEGRAPRLYYPPEQAGRIDEVTVMGLLRHALQMDLGRMNKPEQRRVSDILRRLGWLKGKQKRVPGSMERVRPYVRPRTDCGAEAA